MVNIDLESLRRGDDAAFRALVNEHHSTLMRLAMIYSPSRAVAEETVQDTWLAVLRGLDGFAGRASLRTWICRILVNIARRRAGRECRSMPFSALDEAGCAAVAPDQFLESGPYTGHWKEFRDDWSRLPEDRMLSQELRGVVGAAIAELPDSQQEVIILRDVEGWSTVEVCELLGIEEGYQRVLLHRARSRVRQALEHYLAPPVAAA